MKALALGMVFAALACAAWASGCYDPNKPAPCDPHCTDPPMAARDAGSDRG